MKIKKSMLKTIIKEEIENILKESEQYVYRTAAGKLRIRDDNGNDSPAGHLERQYRHLKSGGEGAALHSGFTRGRREFRAKAGRREPYRLKGI